MNLLDLYKTIEKMQKIIGDDCRVSVSVNNNFGALEIKAEWIAFDKLFRYLKVYHFIELQQMSDYNVVLDLYCIAAHKEYEKVIIENEKDSRPLQ